MRDAIFGCMGGQPENSGELAEETSSEKQFVFDTKGLRSDTLSKRRTESKHLLDKKSERQPEKIGRYRKGYSQGHFSKGQGQTREIAQSRSRATKSEPLASSRVKRRSYQREDDFIRHNGSYETGHCNAQYCKYFERQYQRDILRRQAERLPLLEYTYYNGRPIRGILKKPRFVRTPRLDELIFVEETERSKEAFMDMLASRYPQYAEKISSTTSEDGFPVRGRSRDPRRRATVGYSTSQQQQQQHNRSMDYNDGTMSDIDGPTFHRGGFIRSSLPATRSPPSVDKPPGLVFLIFRDETKKALLPNEITHLDTVRAMFVRSFPGKLTMSYLESPKRKIYILEPRTNIYYQLEDLRDIKDRTVLRVHECDSMEPQRVHEKPEVRGRTIHLPLGSQGIYGALPSSAITSQVHKAQTLPSHMHHPVYMSHDDITQSPARTAYERSRSLTPDPIRSASYAQNPIYGRMGISPERPPPPQDRAGPPDRMQSLRTIPENNFMLNGLRNGGDYYGDYADAYQRSSGMPSPRLVHRQTYPRQAMSPPAVPSVPRVEPGRRAFSPPPNLQNYDYIQVVPSSQATHSQGTFVVKGARASTVVTPQRATGAPPPSSGTTPSHPTSTGVQSQGPQHSWRERSPVGRHSMPLTAVPYSGTGTTHQRSQSYRVPATSDRELVPRPRSMTPSSLDANGNKTRDRIDKMEHQLAHLAHWVQTAVIQSSSSTGAPSSVKSTSSTTSDTSPLLDSSSKLETEKLEHTELLQGLVEVSPDGAPRLSQDMKMNILSIKQQADSLRNDLRSLRRLQQINKESILETVDDAWKKIRDALSTVPGAEHLIIRQQRNEVDVMYKIYLEDKAQADKELGDLEHAVEELRSDVLSRQCRVQMSDVEGMALVLSHVTKQLGDLKVRFPKIQERLKHVMAAEMEVIVREEKFLKEEPERLDNSLKKCKKLTGTLFTLKRLASVQEHRPPQPVALSVQAKIPTMEDKKAVLENIQAMIPDHEARLHGIQAAETARQIKKKITTQQESLRFGKSLELASKALKPHGALPTSQTGEVTTAVSHSPSNGDDTSVISFAMPMSTSTPKGVGQPSTSKSESSATSPSMAYPVMSLMKAAGTEQDSGKSDRQSERKVVKGYQYKTGKNVDFKSEPAVLTVSSSETSSQRKSGKRLEKSSAGKAKTQDFSSQKSAARAAFFSSLSSPLTPTTVSTPVTTMSSLSTDSPTEVSSRISPGSTVASVHSTPALVRSMAVTMPTSSVSTSVSPSYNVCKPSSLPVSGSSTVVSSQKFSPASPSNSSQAGTSRPRTTFTAIPKPYSPTKSTPSPLTPESPKYRIPPSQMVITASGDNNRRSYPQTKSSTKDTRPKKVPPPPPPRKSSRLPGHAVIAVNTATANGQLKTKSADSKLLQSSITMDTKRHSDIIKPPKQFASIELETKVERKSSIGSLKQFTTPLLESKRDKSIEKEVVGDQKPPEMVGKKFSSSNLDYADKGSKNVEKDITLKGDDFVDEEFDSGKKVINGKVTNVSAEKLSKSTRGDSLESTSSSSSLDSQHEMIWVKQKDEDSEPSSSVTQTETEKTDQSASSISSDDKAKSSDSSGSKKSRPPPPERRSSLTSKSKIELEPDETVLADTKGSIDRLV
ncbi:Actin interacting protein 3 [Mactra antiquata]